MDPIEQLEGLVNTLESYESIAKVLDECEKRITLKPNVKEGDYKITITINSFDDQWKREINISDMNMITGLISNLSYAFDVHIQNKRIIAENIISKM